ncbi:MAG: hypothetical protein ABSA16_14495 [Thermoguttaceae bacterium]|jgi:hypothetical protein
MRWLLGLLFGLLIALTVIGCGPAVSSKDMGTIIYEIPRVQGADKPYELPQIITPHKEDANPSLEDENSAESSQHEAEKAEEHKQIIPDNPQSPKPTPARARP